MVLLGHLGMSGPHADRRDGEQAPEPHDHVDLRTDDGTVVRFNDARRFGSFDLVPRDGLSRHRLLAGLGPEPLEPAFTGAVLADGIAGKRTPIKAAILDQRVVAGVGNIYASRGAVPRRHLAAPPGAHGPGRPRRLLAAAIKSVLARRSRPAARRCGIMCRPMASLAISSIAGRSMSAKGSPAPAATARSGAPAASGAWRRPAARLSIVRAVSAEVDSASGGQAGMLPVIHSLAFSPEINPVTDHDLREYHR